MIRTTWLAALTATLLIVAGTATRLLFADLPNFAPVAALALFAGFLLKSRGLACAVPLGIMLTSDLVLGGYDARMMLVVYGMLTLPALLGGPLRNICQATSHVSTGVRWARFAALLACCLGGSVAFFLATNFGTWLWAGIYPRTIAGLTSCYVQALPFFRYTLEGDLFFAAVLFGSLELAWRFAPAAVTKAELAANDA